MEEKKWYKILAPKNFDRKEIGETLAEEPEKIKGSRVEASLGDLIGDPTEGETKVILKIEEIGSGSVYARFDGHKMSRDYVRSLVRKGSSRIDAKADVETADGYSMYVYPLALTAEKAKSTQKKEIRKLMKEKVEEMGEERNFEGFTQALVSGRVGSSLYREAKEIFPLRRVEARKSKVVEIP